MYTIKEIAEILKVSIKTVRRLQRRNYKPLIFINIGSNLRPIYRISELDFKNWLEDNINRS